jgi:hypothetical protein
MVAILATQHGDIFKSRGPEALQDCYILHFLYTFPGHSAPTRLALTARLSARFVASALSLPRLEESKACARWQQRLQMDVC